MMNTVGDGGIKNLDNVDYVWHLEGEEEDRDYYLGGLRHDLRIDVYPQETLAEYDEDDEELYLPPPAPPLPTVHLPPEPKELHMSQLSFQLVAGQHGPDNSPPLMEGTGGMIRASGPNTRKP